MSRVVELQHDWMKDPAFAQEFVKLEEELRQLKAMTRHRGGRPASACTKSGDVRTSGAAQVDAALAPSAARSA